MTVEQKLDLLIEGLAELTTVLEEFKAEVAEKLMNLQLEENEGFGYEE